MEELHPKYRRKPGGSYYRLPKEGEINDGVRIDRGADKWDLSRQSDGGVLVEGKTIRLKIWADKFLEDDVLMEEIEKHNSDWSYDKARELGHWLNDKDWKNVEITSILQFKESPRPDPFVGYVVRSAIHDNRDDPELEGRPDACQAGSSYHSNTAADHLEEKIEWLHVDYSDMKKKNYDKKIPDIDNILNKKVGFKFCLYNTTREGMPIVKSETYHDWKNDGKFKLTWEGYYDGTEKGASSTGAKLMTWGGPYIILKSNKSKYVLYDLEIKEIVPPT
ncbi:MAG: hypothetical protein ACM3ZS_00185 [Nitrososphaerota archaeon]